MNPEQVHESVGWQLGADGVRNIVEHVERYCACEDPRESSRDRRHEQRTRGDHGRRNAAIQFAASVVCGKLGRPQRLNISPAPQS